ncbi:hypothetical protein PROFUN_01263 [Planoprotostelium fungivorum]|uniref:SH2 domain-containing protein n=1 Tax=Planoprotostelium fungivorum TaxID=1890364 RepID=A0A2P6NZM4_9EUKA|nr:hypothetical protein PROFUN_01263 [Planoprotostelium fungivorum]
MVPPGIEPGTLCVCVPATVQEIQTHWITTCLCGRDVSFACLSAVFLCENVRRRMQGIRELRRILANSCVSACLSDEHPDEHSTVHCRFFTFMFCSLNSLENHQRLKADMTFQGTVFGLFKTRKLEKDFQRVKLRGYIGLTLWGIIIMTTESKLNAAKAISINLISRLKEKCEQGDANEYIEILQYVYNVSTDFHRWRDQPDMQIPTEIDTQMSSFADIINGLTSNNRLPRYLLSSRLRRIMDVPATSLYVSASNIAHCLGDRRSGHSYPDIDRLTDKLLTECQDAKMFWERSFGQSMMVPFEHFAAQLSACFEMRDYVHTQLRYLLDYSYTGYVSVRRFATLIRGYGPMPKLLENITTLFRYNWFHGYLSTKEAEILLKPQPQGTFLVRFSKASCDSIVISCHLYSSSSEPIVHTVVSKLSANTGYVVEDASRGRQEFPTLLGVVQRYNLTNSLQSQVTKLGWFFGDVQGSEAGELLADKTSGTYLIRFSSQPNHYAITHISDRTVKHGLIECTPAGFKLEHSPKVSLDLIETLSQSKLLKSQLPGVPLLATPPDQPTPGSFNEHYIVLPHSYDEPTPLDATFYNRPESPTSETNSSMYGSIPSFNRSTSSYPSTTAYTLPSNFNSNAPSANYGTLPSPFPSNGSPAISQPVPNYGTLPSHFVQQMNLNHGSSTTNQAAQNYGAIPSPGTFNGYPPPRDPSTTSPPPASQNYGTLPSPGFSPSSSSYGLPVNNGLPANHGFTSFPPTRDASSTTSQGQANYGTLPSPNAFSPVSLHSSNKSVPNSFNQYPSQANNLQQSQNYGTLPSPGGFPSFPPGSPSSPSEYHTVPTPTNTSTPNYGVFPSGKPPEKELLRNSSANSNPPAQYHSFPAMGSPKPPPSKPEKPSKSPFKNILKDRKTTVLEDKTTTSPPTSPRIDARGRPKFFQFQLPKKPRGRVVVECIMASTDCIKCQKRVTLHKTGWCEVCRSNAPQYKARKRQYEQSDKGRHRRKEQKRTDTTSTDSITSPALIPPPTMSSAIPILSQMKNHKTSWNNSYPSIAQRHVTDYLIMRGLLPPGSSCPSTPELRAILEKLLQMFPCDDLVVGDNLRDLLDVFLLFIAKCHLQDLSIVNQLKCPTGHEEQQPPMPYQRVEN